MELIDLAVGGKNWMRKSSADEAPKASPWLSTAVGGGMGALRGALLPGLPLAGLGYLAGKITGDGEDEDGKKSNLARNLALLGLLGGAGYGAYRGGRAGYDAATRIDDGPETETESSNLDSISDNFDKWRDIMDESKSSPNAPDGDKANPPKTSPVQHVDDAYRAQERRFSPDNRYGL